MKLALVVMAAVVLLIAFLPPCNCSQNRLRVGTFNIENCPKSQRQLAGALNLVESLDVEALAVQEIREPAVFARGVDDYLGDDWEVVYADQPDVRHRVGLLVDSGQQAIVDVETHDETVIHRGARATLEVRLQGRDDSAQVIRMFVVHLKSGSDGETIRKKQLARLRPVLETAVASGDDVVVAGDFNTTEDADRRRMAELADATKLLWSSRRVECTSYWEREDACPGSSLDHVLSNRIAHHVSARGACETVGCEPGASCPVYTEWISDHCPVVAEY